MRDFSQDFLDSQRNSLRNFSFVLTQHKLDIEKANQKKEHQQKIQQRATFFSNIQTATAQRTKIENNKRIMYKKVCRSSGRKRKIRISFIVN